MSAESDEALELELKELELQKKELELQKKEIALKKRKAGMAATPAKKKAPVKKKEVDLLQEIFPSGAGGDAVKPVHVKKLPPGTKVPDHRWRNLAMVIIVPLVLLVLAIYTLHALYDKEVCPTPCNGICAISKEMISSAPKGCMPEEPQRVFINMVPGTSSDELLLPLVQGLADPKEFEFVKMRPWRDVCTHQPVYLSPVQKNLAEEGYDGLYMQMNFNLINVNASRSPCTKPKKLIMGKSYFHDLVPDNNLTNQTVREDPIRSVVILREPMERFRDQLDEELSKRNDVNKFYGKTDIYDRLDLPGCLEVKPCMRHRQLSRWCNLQTRMVCGWHRDCAFVKDGQGEIQPTQKMLDRALANLEANYSAVLIAEEWDLSMQLLEATHPTYLEGLAAAAAASPPPYCKSVAGEMVCPAGSKSKEPMHLGYRKQLEQHCWADIALYEKAKELFHRKAQMCKLESSSQ